LRNDREAREADERARERRRRTVQLGSIGVFVAVAAVAALIAISQSGGGSETSSTVGSGGGTNLADVGLVENQLAGIPQSGTVLGDPNAKVRIVEYGDLQCPVCRAFSFQVAPELISGPVSDGTADYEFKNWTIIGPESTDAAKASLAAGEQGRYWNYVELFYRNQGQENSGYVTDDFLESVAEGAGVPDIARWNQDRKSSKWDRILAQDEREATGFGFSGTPSIVVQGPGGTKPLGTASLGQIEAAINQVQ
jgi:protein-disulfide isomerase